jgi:glycosyltransferase involved in cell wall biosynthesis
VRAVTRGPLVVFGVPLYNSRAFVDGALHSLLDQSAHNEIRLVLVDDCSTDGTAELAAEIAAGDYRATFVANTKRLGLVRNWQRAYDLARQAYPAAPYFAWGSDHDLWHRDWVSRLAWALDCSPDALLAFPSSGRLTGAGVRTRRGRPPAGNTMGTKSGVRRAAETVVGASVGTIVYGLFRAEALDRVRLHQVLAPDRLLLAELALQGEFMLVPEELWWRRFKHEVSSRRQREAFLLKGAIALGSYLPWPLQHVAVLGSAGVRRNSSRTVSRTALLTTATIYLPLAVVRSTRMRTLRTARRLRRNWRWLQGHTLATGRVLRRRLAMAKERGRREGSR